MIRDSKMPSRETYADEHRIFLQGLMCKGVLNAREVDILHEKALKACNIEIPDKKKERDEMLVNNIQIINAEIKKIGLLIRKGQDEDNGKSCFMLINNSNRMCAGSRDLGSAVQTQWSQQQLEYLRLVATDILQSDTKTISSREALHLTDKVTKGGNKKMSLEEAEDTINKLITARWIKTLDGNRQLTLDVRFIGEMESWMVEIMGRDHMAYCKSCRKLVIRGRYCDCGDNIAWHNYCIEKQTNSGVDVKCFQCGTKIAEKKGDRNGQINGHHSSHRSEPASQMEERAGPSGSRRPRRSSRDDSDDEVMVERGEPSKASRRRRSSRDEDDDMVESSQIIRSGGRIKRRMSADSSDSD